MPRTFLERGRPTRVSLKKKVITIIEVPELALRAHRPSAREAQAVIYIKDRHHKTIILPDLTANGFRKAVHKFVDEYFPEETVDVHEGAVRDSNREPPTGDDTA